MLKVTWLCFVSIVHSSSNVLSKTRRKRLISKARNIIFVETLHKESHEYTVFKNLVWRSVTNLTISQANFTEDNWKFQNANFSFHSVFLKKLVLPFIAILSRNLSSGTSKVILVQRGKYEHSNNLRNLSKNHSKDIILIANFEQISLNN